MASPNGSLFMLMCIMAIFGIFNTYIISNKNELVKEGVLKKKTFDTILFAQFFLPVIALIFGYVIYFGNPFGEMPMPSWLKALFSFGKPVTTPTLKTLYFTLILVFGILSFILGIIGMQRKNLLKSRTFESKTIETLYIAQTIVSLLFLIFVFRYKNSMCKLPTTGSSPNATKV